MGYEVKEFFQEYFFEAVYPLKRFSRNLYSESLALDTKKQKNLAEFFSLNTQNQIYFEKDPEVLFSINPYWFFKVFIWVAERNYNLSYEVTRAIEQNVNQSYPIFTNDNFDSEIQIEALQNMKWSEVKPQVDEVEFNDGKKRLPWRLSGCILPRRTDNWRPCFNFSRRPLVCGDA